MTMDLNVRFAELAVWFQFQIETKNTMLTVYKQIRKDTDKMTFSTDLASLLNVKSHECKH